MICLLLFGSRDFTANCGEREYSTAARSNDDLIKFAGQFHIKVTNQPTYVEKVTVPLKFNDIYKHYNDIQKEMGLDLEKYKGRQCIKYTFDVQNETDDSPVEMNLLVLDERVIAADLSEKYYNGSMRSLVKK